MSPTAPTFFPSHSAPWACEQSSITGIPYFVETSQDPRHIHGVAPEMDDTDRPSPVRDPALDVFRVRGEGIRIDVAKDRPRSEEDGRRHRPDPAVGGMDHLVAGAHARRKIGGPERRRPVHLRKTVSPSPRSPRTPARTLSSHLYRYPTVLHRSPSSSRHPPRARQRPANCQNPKWIQPRVPRAVPVPLPATVVSYSHSGKGSISPKHDSHLPEQG